MLIFSSEKINVTKNTPFFAFGFVFIKVNIFVQQKAWAL